MNALQQYIRSEKGEGLSFFLLVLVPSAIFAVLLFNGILLRLGIVGPVYLDADSSGYLIPAIIHYDHGEFWTILSRSAPYPLFLAAIFKLFGTMNAVAPIQHAINLAGITLMFVVCMRLGTLFPKRPFTRALIAGAGLTFATINLKSMSMMSFEHSMRPESLYSAVVALVVAIQVEIFIAGVKKQQSILALLLFLSICVNIFSYVFRPNVGFAILLGPFIALVLSYFASVKWKKITFACVAGVVLSYALIIWPDNYFGRKDLLRSQFLPLALLGCHGNLLLPVIARDIQDPNFTRVNKDALKLLYKAIEEESDAYLPGRPPENRIYPVLGINPDNFMYRNLNAKAFVDSFPSMKEFSRVAFYYFAKLIIQETGSYFSKIRRQLAIVYGPSGEAFYGDVPHNFPELYKISNAMFLQIDLSLVSRALQMQQDYVRTTTPIVTGPEKDWENAALNRQRFSIKAITYLNESHRWLYWIFPITFLGLFLGSKVFLRKSTLAVDRVAQDGIQGLLWLGFFVGFLEVYIFLHVLSVGAIGSLEVSRYVKAQFSTLTLFVVLSYAFEIALVFEMVRVLFRVAMGIRTSRGSGAVVAQA